MCGQHRQKKGRRAGAIMEKMNGILTTIVPGTNQKMDASGGAIRWKFGK